MKRKKVKKKSPGNISDSGIASESGSASRPERIANPTPTVDSNEIQKAKREEHQKLLGLTLNALQQKIRLTPAADKERSEKYSNKSYLQSLPSSGNKEEIKEAITYLKTGGSEISGQDQSALINTLISAATEQDAIKKYLNDDLPLAAEMILAADAARMPMQNILRQVEQAGQQRALTKHLLFMYARRKLDTTPDTDGKLRSNNSLGPELYNWIWNSGILSLNDDWNKKEDGLAGTVYNHLWNSGQYDKICELIRLGVDTMQPCVRSRDVGRDDEGVWSGYVQPLEHLLSKYLKRVDQLNKRTLPQGENQTKVEGAQKILAVLGTRKQPPAILTSYDAVKKSELLEEFKKNPGTFWGFEDVRLPYVQAARETEKGARPLRMMDMWAAVEKVLKADDFRQLLQSPAETIERCIKAGREEAEEGFKAAAEGRSLSGSKADYQDIRDKEAYLKAFEEQARSFLDFLAKQSPEAKVITAELTGRDAGKLMGALACKAGLWWARKKGEPVYYCLDGIDLEDVASYKAYKTKLINAGFTKRGGEVGTTDLYYEVITFAELREILRKDNWPLLKDIVKFVRKGEVLTEKKGLDEIHQLRNRIQQEGPADRTSPPRTVLNKKAGELGIDPNLTAEMNDTTLRKIVVKITSLELASKADHLPLFLAQLHDSEILTENAVLSKRIYGMFYQLAAETDGSARARLADGIKNVLANTTEAGSELLRNALTEVAQRLVTTPPAKDDLLTLPKPETEPVPSGTSDDTKT